MRPPSRLSLIMAHVNTGTSWREKARAKYDEVLSSIPTEWRLQGPAPSAEEQRDITGLYIQQLLSSREVEITETDATGIVQRTSTGQWTAEEVTRAFAHRAALAHQLVSGHTFSFGIVV